MITLAIDASTYRGTVAVVEGRTVLASGEAAMRDAHAETLMPTVARTIAASGSSLTAIGRVICGAGPGSFTSLRIAAGIAKGIALGSGIPMYAVSSLGLVLAASPAPPGVYVVTLDALRGEWYAMPFIRRDDRSVTGLGPMVVGSKPEVLSLALAARATLIGGIVGPPAPHAAGCVDLADEIANSGPVDLDRWEPAYGRLAEAQVKWEASNLRALA